MYILTAEEMRNVDRIAIEEIGIPGVVLMEHAALSVLAEIEKSLGDVKGRRFAVFCGRGNNGGDGLALSHLLIQKGAECYVFLSGTMEEIGGDAGINLSVLRGVGGYIAEVTQKESIKFIEKQVRESDVIIDAILGTGIKGEVRGINRDLIEFINTMDKPVVSVDIPSGLNSDTGRPMGVAVKSDITVTFGYPKVGEVIYPGAEYTGRLVVADIGYPARTVEEVNPAGRLLTREELPFIKDREKDTHKGNYGHVLVIGGSKDFIGAPVISSLAALKSGAGLVTMAVPSCIAGMVSGRTLEVIPIALCDEDGYLGKGALDEVLTKIDRFDVVAVGPGLGMGGSVKAFMDGLIRNCPLPMVIDADGLNNIDPSLLLKSKASVVVTPHPGEMARLTNRKTEEINDDRISSTRDFTRRYKAACVLKGARTVIAAENRYYISPTGNPGMATAGSGDVLTGVIAGFIGQGFSITDAAILGTYIHGLAGDMLVEKRGEYGMTATDIALYIPAAINALKKETIV
ncbi:MAG: NAD(P)H-hydrate dehydratase [Thermoanaerobacteraceae bacterium]|nr:NAD(P)H-hydrate dehydratase [Thermoanaerobacteraceae bacterium]